MMTWLALLLSTAAASPGGVVAEVTVFPDRAQITRSIEVPLKKGVTEVVFSDLPPGLDENTLQARGEAQVSARILGIETRTEELAEDRRAAVAVLNKEINALDQQIVAQNDAKAAARSELAFLQQVNAATAKQLSAELLFAPETAGDVEAVAGVLRSRIPEVQKSARDASVEIARLEREVQAKRREMSETAGSAQWSRRDVVVTVESDKAGDGAVLLSYVIGGASWSPTYDARADLKAGTVALTLSALVRQTTGEDWTGAALSLSTARPSVGVDAPTVSPFWLESAAVYPVYDEWEYAEEPAYYDEEEMDDMAPMEAAAPMPAPAVKKMAVAVAKVSERMVATTFELDHPVTIPGDGTRRKVEVASNNVEVALVHKVMPSVDTGAWLTARGTWTVGWPLLPGTVHSFLGESYVGTGRLAGTGQGGELELGFGRDESVVVADEIVQDLVTDGWFRTTLTRETLCTVTNGRSTPIQLEVVEALPISRDSDYRVWWTGDEPDERTLEGIGTYVRPLDPSASTAISLGFSLKYPKGNPPGGL